eukprot:scaffold10592_cov85-Isochrysis_galbana.AAC.1
MGALFIAAGAWRRLILASAALLEAWGRDLEAWHWLAARLAADEGGSRALSPSAEAGGLGGACGWHGRAVCCGWRVAEAGLGLGGAAGGVGISRRGRGWQRAGSG